MKILIVGKGAREHAFAWKIAQSPKITQLYAAPGSPGIAQYAECVDLSDSDFDGLIGLVQKEQIDLTLVGPEIPLAEGIVDRFQEAGLTIFGPTQAAAQIEADKDFALELMHKYDIPTGAYATFTEPEPAREYIREKGVPIVLKASGLAAGKGVLICHTLDEALQGVEEIVVDQAFGEAGNKLVVMEYLEGEEASIFAFTDGEDLVYLLPAQDHKTIDEGDVGLNTGGMGAYAPAPVVTPELMQEAQDRIMAPTVKALAKEGRPYKGILYLGLILTADGPKVIEFNCRLGDPEAQVVLPLLKTDLVDILTAVCNSTVKDLNIELDNRAATTVVMASGGYPEAYETGFPIKGLDEAEALGDVVIFHAGTGAQNSTLVTGGGRVLAVTAMANDIPSAISHAYKAVDQISFQGHYFRKDIGHRALARLEPV
ncbi:MAG: phosphoribosylamine--glycine ligase [bacterium]|nr:phosphoribosylamine--glycine ligase [bacterium]